jgi:hypothetical protein
VFDRCGQAGRHLAQRAGKFAELDYVVRSLAISVAGGGFEDAG